MKRNGRAWNNGKLDLSPVKMKRKRGNYRATVGAPCESVFALIPALFAPSHGETHWFVTHDNPGAYRVGAVLLKPELAIGKLEIELAARDEGTSVSLDFVYTAISTQGNALFDDELGGRIQQMLCAFVEALQGRSVAPDELRLPGRGPISGLRDAFRPKSAGARYEIVLRGGADECFALACPVAELRWIDDWQFHLLYSDSGRNEDDCIFIEAVSGFAIHRVARSDTYWYTTLYDPAARRFHAVLLTGDFILGRWTLEVDPQGGGSSRMRFALTDTGLTEEGNRIILESGFEARVANMLRFIASSARHYTETGEIRSQNVSSVIVLKVRGYHVDVFGHVNHARYLEFLEEARWAFFEEWPALTAALHARGIIHVVVNINIDYKSQATVGDLLRIETEPIRVGSSSLVVAQTIRHAGSGTVVVDAKVTNVFLDSASGKTTSARDEFVAPWPWLRT